MGKRRTQRFTNGLQNVS
uniref:Uncharacterized protein n=1 Tax=Anguilla anguilla TaxID=7936 RepID=A0A0E9TUA4_ANGAN